MSQIRSQNTRPEMMVGGAYMHWAEVSVHEQKVPGTPDLFFLKFHAITFVLACFWYDHNCQLGVLPKSNAAFWFEKIALTLVGSNRQQLKELNCRSQLFAF